MASAVTVGAATPLLAAAGIVAPTAGASIGAFAGYGAVTGAIGGAVDGFISELGNAIFLYDVPDGKEALKLAARGGLFGTVGGAVIGGAIGAGIGIYHKLKNVSGANPATPANPNPNNPNNVASRGNSTTSKTSVSVENPHPNLNTHINGLNEGAQGKHVPNQFRGPNQKYKGTPYIQGRSTIEVDPMKILMDVYSGNYTFVRQAGSNPIIKMNYNVGTFYNTSGMVGPTPYVKIHANSKGLVHFVPWLPNPNP